jgi:FixJ family two-component response regulator
MTRRPLSLTDMVTTTTRPACVAVVDDDENLRRSFARLLRAAGMQPFTYASAEAFLAEPVRPRFDCLVLDVHLPGMSGLQLHGKLNAEGYDSAVLFITAYDDSASRKEAYAMGCTGYFHKSDSGEQVLTAIRDVIARRSRAG